jgi:hypothetical protein
VRANGSLPVRRAAGLLAGAGALALAAGAGLAASPWPRARGAGGWLAAGGLAGLGAATLALALRLRGAPPGDPRPALPPLGAPGGAALAALLAFALALRLVGLGSDLWYDEIVTLVEFVRLPLGPLLTSFPSQNNHPLFSLLAKGSIALLGESPFALRLPAALLGTACVAALFAFARPFVGNAQAFGAALWLAVSYHHVWFSQNARGYTGLMLATIVATGLFAEGMRRRARSLWLVYGLALGLGLYVHLTAVFAFAAHALLWTGLLALHRAGVRGVARRWPGALEAWPLTGFLAGGLLGFALYAPLLPDLVGTFLAQAVESGGHRVAAWRSPVWTALEMLRSLRLGVGSGLVVAAGGAVAALGFARLLRREPLVALLLVAPAPLTLAALLALSFHVWPRYFFPYQGFALLVAVHGLFAAAALATRALAAAGVRLAPAPLGAALTALAAAALAAGLPANYRLPKQSYVAARDWVESRRAPGDAVAAAGLAAFAYGRYYAPQWSAVASAAELEALGAGGTRTWLVYSFPTFMREIQPDVLALADARFEPMRTFPGTLGDGQIVVLRSRAP